MSNNYLSPAWVLHYWIYIALRFSTYCKLGIYFQIKEGRKTLGAVCFFYIYIRSTWISFLFEKRVYFSLGIRKKSKLFVRGDVDRAK